ncbi:hypothetical protein MSAS_39550 [Mycobacterium saskatchewanense]|uniref:Uncharacterized protein n=1 Tax=Mycobacterium intracellulare 1956 TaxID=1299331 RepID=X8CHH0_MYCIT|nr:hypothetical protein I548_0386 [Mycobacterium intracellulare]EUA55792.1 hypothetical protein I550_3949 [Mycobacterium intracellulare 1956]BBX64781.1 hypothetical protein MSAS_39550 [Mycobacterium saskatchewanense]
MALTPDRRTSTHPREDVFTGAVIGFVVAPGARRSAELVIRGALVHISTPKNAEVFAVTFT